MASTVSLTVPTPLDVTLTADLNFPASVSKDNALEANSFKMLDMVKISHLWTFDTIDTGVSAHFAADSRAIPTAQATTSINIDQAMQRVFTAEGYSPPSSTDLSKYIIPSVLQFVLLFCKHAVVTHIECRIGNITAGTDNRCKSFETSIANDCHAHVSAIIQIIQSKIPFKNDMRTMATHLELCKNEVVRYIARVREISRVGVSNIPLVAPHSSTKAIFSASASPSVDEIIYNCLQPWLRMLFISSFVSVRKPSKFTDLWRAQLIIYVVGYLFVSKLDASTTDATNKGKLTALKTSIATHMNMIVTSEPKITALFVATMEQISANANLSKALTSNGIDLEFRRKNMELMGAHYMARKADSTKAVRWFYVSVAVYALLTTIVALLMVSTKLAPFSMIGAGLIMIVIIIYVLVIQIQGSK